MARSDEAPASFTTTCCPPDTAASLATPLEPAPYPPGTNSSADAGMAARASNALASTTLGTNVATGFGIERLIQRYLT